MKIEMEIVEYSPDRGIRYSWENGFVINTRIEGKMVVIEANREGLITLAHHLLTLAQVEVPSGYHIHYDELNSLEDGSCEMVIEKIE